MGHFRPERGTQVFLWADRAEGTLHLTRAGGGLALETRIEHRGWSLEGVADPAAHPVLRFASRRILGDVVEVRSGAYAAVREVDPGGSLTVEPLYLDVAKENLNLEFLDPVRGHVTCDELAVDSAREKTSVDGPSRYLKAGTILRASPEGTEVARVKPGTTSSAAHVLERGGQLSRVALTTGFGFDVIGWVSRDAFTDRPSERGDVVGGIVGSADKGESCRATEPLEVVATAGGEEYAVGTVAAQTPFRVIRRHGDGRLAIRPPEEVGLRPPLGRRWIVRPGGAAVHCGDEVGEPL